MADASHKLPIVVGQMHPASLRVPFPFRLNVAPPESLVEIHLDTTSTPILLMHRVSFKGEMVRGNCQQRQMGAVFAFSKRGKKPRIGEWGRQFGQVPGTRIGQRRSALYRSKRCPEGWGSLRIGSGNGIRRWDLYGTSEVVACGQQRTKGRGLEVRGTLAAHLRTHHAGRELVDPTLWLTAAAPMLPAD